MDLKSAIAEVAGQLTALEATARKLPNQNFADIVKAAHVRVTQLTQHPDVDKVDEIGRAEHGESNPPQGVFAPQAEAPGVGTLSGEVAPSQNSPPFPA